MRLKTRKPIKRGEAGYRSLCLVHAKHALCHLSYVPGTIYFGCFGYSFSTPAKQNKKREKKNKTPEGLDSDILTELLAATNLLLVIWDHPLKLDMHFICVTCILKTKRFSFAATSHEKADKIIFPGPFSILTFHKLLFFVLSSPNFNSALPEGAQNVLRAGIEPATFCV